MSKGSLMIWKAQHQAALIKPMIVMSSHLKLSELYLVRVCSQPTKTQLVIITKSACFHYWFVITVPFSVESLACLYISYRWLIIKANLK